MPVAYLPEEQERHEVLLGPEEKVPAVQSAQEEAPLEFAAVPAGQSTHPAAPPRQLYVPGGHCVHGCTRQKPSEESTEPFGQAVTRSVVVMLKMQ